MHTNVRRVQLTIGGHDKVSISENGRSAARRKNEFTLRVMDVRVVRGWSLEDQAARIDTMIQYVQHNICARIRAYGYAASFICQQPVRL